MAHRDGGGGLHTVYPIEFFAVKDEKSRVEPLASFARLRLLYFLLLLTSAVSFALLFWFYFFVDTSTATVISRVPLDGYDCEMISSMPPRTVKYSCGTAANGAPDRCLLSSSSSFGGLFGKDQGEGTVPFLDQSGAFTFEIAHPSQFFPTYDACMAPSSLSTLCGQPDPSQTRLLSLAKWKYHAGKSNTWSPTIGNDGTVYVGNGYGLSAINPDGSFKWFYSAAVKGKPAYRSGIVYFGSTNRRLYAVEEGDGTLKWIYPPKDAGVSAGVFRAPAISRDGTIIYVTNEDGNLYAITRDGTLKWKRPTDGLTQAIPAIGVDGTIYVGGLNNKLYAINPDRTEKWIYPTDGGSVSGPAIGVDGTIYVGSSDKLYAITPDRTLKWIYTKNGGSVGEPAVGDDGTIYVGISEGSGPNDNKLYAITPDRTLKWTCTIGGAVFGRPAIGPDSTLFVSSYDHRLYAISRSGSKKWAYITNGRVRSIAAISNDGTVVYVGSDDGFLHAIAAHIPRAAIVYLTGAAIQSSPAIGRDGTVYVGGRDTKLHAVNPDGSGKWTVKTDSTVGSPAIGSDGTIYVGSGETLYAVNPDGTLQWTCTTNASVGALAISSNGTVYVGGGNLQAISPDGVVKWKLPPAGDEFNAPAIGRDGTIYVGSGDNLHAVRPDGTKKWQYPTAGEIRTRPAISSDGIIYVGSKGAKLFAIFPNRTLKWACPTNGEVTASPVVGSDGTVYAGSRNRKLYAINPDDGTKKWTYTTGDELWSRPTIGSDGTVYLGCFDTKLHAVNPDGTQKWTYTTDGFIAGSPAIGDDGTVYVGSRDNKLHMYLHSDISPFGHCSVRGLLFPGSKQQSGVRLPNDAAVLLPATTMQECAQQWQAKYCDLDSPAAVSMQKQYCSSFLDHPPYSCTRQEQRSWLEAASLSFGIAEFVWAAVVFFMARVLWQHYKNRGKYQVCAAPASRKTAGLELDSFSDNRRAAGEPPMKQQERYAPRRWQDGAAFEETGEC